VISSHPLGTEQLPQATARLDAGQNPTLVQAQHASGRRAARCRSAADCRMWPVAVNFLKCIEWGV
jgi:hypothetical protein